MKFTLNLSKQSLSKYKKRDTLPYKEIAYFCAKRNISINWVLFEQLPRSLESETEKYTRIKYFTKIQASAGGGAYQEGSEFKWIEVPSPEISKLYSSCSVSPHISLGAISVLGDSMEPLLSDGDVVLFDISERELIESGLFIYSSSEGLFIKELQRVSDESLVLKSHNPLYENIHLGIDEIETSLIMGKVLAKVKLLESI